MDYLGVKVPQNLSLAKAINFCNRLWTLDDADHYEFDFNRLGRVEPFTMAYVATEIKKYRATKPKSKFTAINHQTHYYAAHMGFFRAFGLKFGNEPGEAAGSSTYLPLTILPIDEIKREAIERSSDVGDIIENKANEVSRILIQKDDGDVVDTLTFSIREIMRNVAEHSNSENIEYCAQYWRTKELVEVALLDTGVGIRKALSNNPHLQMENDRDAVHLCLLPGISGKMFKGVRGRKNDVWQNSGFGLYMTCRICRSGGSFFICSGDSGILLDNNTKKDFSTLYVGTALRLRISTSSINNLSSMLERFKKEGFETAQGFDKKNATEPSIASTMLLRDFSK